MGFAVPGAYFLARGFINGALGRRLGLLFLMGGAQGLVGWWMVRSGLKVSSLFAVFVFCLQKFVFCNQKSGQGWGSVTLAAATRVACQQRRAAGCA